MQKSLCSTASRSPLAYSLASRPHAKESPTVSWPSQTRLQSPVSFATINRVSIPAQSKKGCAAHLRECLRRVLHVRLLLYAIGSLHDLHHTLSLGDCVGVEEGCASIRGVIAQSTRVPPSSGCCVLDVHGCDGIGAPASTALSKNAPRLLQLHLWTPPLPPAHPLCLKSELLECAHAPV